MKARITAKVYFIFLLLLPFVHFSIVVDPVLIPRQLYLSIFVLLVVFLLYAQRANQQFIAFKNPLYIAIGSYILLAILTSYGNHFTSESHYVLSKQLVVFSFLIVTVHALYNKIIDINFIIKGCIGIGIVAIVGAYYHWIEKTIDGEKIFRRAGLVKSFFANKNLLASVIFLCFPFFLMGLMQSKKIKIISSIGIVSAFPILILLGTRAVFLALAILVLLIGCFYLNAKYGVRKRIIGLGGVVLLALAILIYKNFVVTKVQEISNTENATEQYFHRIANSKTLVSRTKFWDNSISMWQEKPLLGVGLGHWQVEFPKHRLNKFSEFSISNGLETLQRPHNDFLNILCENGIFGLLAYIFIFGIIYYQLLFLIRNTKSTNERWHFIYSLGGITGFIVISFLDFPMERIEHQILLMIMFAITTSQYYLKIEMKSKPTLGSNMLLGIVATASFYSLIVTAFRFKGEKETVKMYQAKANEQWGEMLYAANNAENYFYTIDATSIPIDWYKGIASFNRNEIDQALTYFESAYEKAPYQIQVINNLAICYEYKGNREKAKAYYLKALAISSGFEEARLNLAATYFNEKQYHMAFEVIDKVKINCTNKKYKKYLIPILAKEINIILAKNNDLELSRKIAEKITKSVHIYGLYYDAKLNNISFEAEIVSFKNKELKV